MPRSPASFTFVALLAALSAAATARADDAPASPATAAPSASTRAQVPGYYRQTIGRLQVTALFDGVVYLPRDQLLGLDRKAIDDTFAHRYVPETAKGFQTSVNAYLVDDGAHLTLVDAGTTDCFGPGLGQVPVNLRRAGYDPARVENVLITHAHPDHLCGILDAQGKQNYPNATVWLAAEDAAYWLDPASEKTAPDLYRPLFAMERKAVAPYEAAHRLHRFTAGDALPAGVQVVATHGHTPGHTAWLFDGGDGARFVVWGDVVHYPAVQFAHPQAYYVADADHGKAVTARRGLFARAADAGWWIGAAHLPFPGIGHVRREDKAFAWVPAEFTPSEAPATATR